MAYVQVPDGGVLDHRQIASSSAETLVARDGVGLSAPLDLIRRAITSVEDAKVRYPDYRLTRLVSARLELDDEDALGLFDVVGTPVVNSHPAHQNPRPFEEILRALITRHGLKSLFADGGHAPHHHAIRPTGYDFVQDEVIPTGMERWRADYRAMPDHRQMLAASIIWLYRGGKDNVWLRRVPCTWHAADAIARMRAANCLDDWARLFAFYPGW